MPAKFFRTQKGWRAWLAKNHAKVQELVVGLHKKESGKTSITYPQAVDEALCFGWIDGVRKRIDDDSYSVRFTPRKSRSIWSKINLKRAAELEEAGAMHVSGLAAFKGRDPKRAGVYSFENQPKKLPPALEKAFKADKKAWDFFQTQPPGYKRLAAWWIMSAKKSETQEHRLAELMKVSAKSKRLGVASK